MAIINRVKKETNVPKRVTFKGGIYQELLLYAEHLGFDMDNSKNENEAINYTVNEALKYVFSKDKDYKVFKDNKFSHKHDEASSGDPSSNSTITE